MQEFLNRRESSIRRELAGAEIIVVHFYHLPILLAFDLRKSLESFPKMWLIETEGAELDVNSLQRDSFDERVLNLATGILNNY